MLKQEIKSAMKIPKAIAANAKFVPVRLRSSLINGFGIHVVIMNNQPIINAILIFLIFNLLKYNILHLEDQTSPTNSQNIFPLIYKTTSSPFVLIDLISLNLYLLDLYSTNNQCNNYLAYVQVFEQIVLML